MLELSSKWSDGYDRYMIKPLVYKDLRLPEDKCARAMAYLEEWLTLLCLTKCIQMDHGDVPMCGQLPADWGDVNSIYDMPMIVWLAPVKTNGKKTRRSTASQSSGYYD